MSTRAAFLFAASAVALSAQCPSSSLDTAFAGWTSTAAFSIPSTNPFTTGPSASGGNPGDCFSVTQGVIGGVGGAGITLVHMPPAATPLPTTGIGRVDLSMDVRMTGQSPSGIFGGVVGLQFVCEQGGVFFVATNTYSLVFFNAPWGPRVASNLTASSFERFGQPGVHPDFATGGPVRFGFYTGNGNSNGGAISGGVGTTVSLYDNFAVAFVPAAAAVDVVPGCGVPSPPTLAATAPAFGAAVVITLSGAAPLAAGGVFTSALPAFPEFVAGCPLALELATTTPFLLLTTDGSGGWSTSFVVPSICALAGMVFPLQAAVEDPASPFGYALSNGLWTVVGA